MMKSFIALALFMLASLAQANTNGIMRLWPGDAPGALGKGPKDIPTLTSYFPDADKATGAAMIILPGGRYANLDQTEGKDYALWLNDHGIAGFVLKYRLGSAGYRHPVMLWDVARAVRYVRANAAQWRLNPHRIGVIGSSAGGHLAATLLTHFDAGKSDDPDSIERESSRPDLGILCYAVITMGDGTHVPSRDNLLGTNPPPELINELSNEKHVTKNTPPCLIWATAGDPKVPVSNSLEFAAALKRAQVPFALHIYAKGEHGIGLGLAPESGGHPGKLHPWTQDCLDWLTERGFLK